MSGFPEPMSDKPSITLIAFYDEVALGLRTLHAILTAAGYPCRIIFFQGWRQLGTWPTEPELSSLFSVLEKDESEVYGLSFRSFAYPLAKRVTEEIHIRKRATVIWGGSHATLSPEECIKVADIVCVGEAEDAMLEFIQALDEGREYSDIKNLWVKTEDGVKRNPIRPLVQDIDSVPWPVFGNQGKTTIVGNEFIQGDLMLGGSGPATYYLLGSRGCPFSCEYCCNSAFREIYAGAGPYIRKRSPENIIGELEHAKNNLDVVFISFMDELFTLDKSWTLDICSLYKKRIGIPFTCEVHPKTVDEDIARALGKAGTRIAVIGVQSGSERVGRDVYNRQISNQDILMSGRLLHEQGILVHYDFIFDNPYETRADLEDSFKLLLELPRPNHLELMSLAFYPGTKITERALKDNMISPEEVEGATQKPVKTFLHRFAQARNIDHAFYSMLFWLSQLKFSFKYMTFYYYAIHDEYHPVHVFPLAVLRRMEKIEWFAHNPKRLYSIHRLFMVQMNRLLTPLRWIKTGVELVFKGEFKEIHRRIKARTGSAK